MELSILLMLLSSTLPIPLLKNIFSSLNAKAYQENEHEVQACWYNCNGTMLYVGKAKALSEKYLCISNGKKYGVMSHDGNRIINCLYDEIVLSDELLIVLRGDKLGLYDLDGNIILDAFLRFNRECCY